MTTEDAEYIKEVFNKEITKLRKEIWYLSQADLLRHYCQEDINRAFHYFNAYPIMDSLNRKSLEVLIECCQNAELYRMGKNR